MVLGYDKMIAVPPIPAGIFPRLESPRRITLALTARPAKMAVYTQNTPLYYSMHKSALHHGNLLPASTLDTITEKILQKQARRTASPSMLSLTYEIDWRKDGFTPLLRDITQDTLYLLRPKLHEKFLTNPEKYHDTHEEVQDCWYEKVFLHAPFSIPKNISDYDYNGPAHIVINTTTSEILDIQVQPPTHREDTTDHNKKVGRSSCHRLRYGRIFQRNFYQYLDPR